MDVKIKSYIFAYAPDCRKRHQHHRFNNEIIEFIVQLEILVKNKWYPAIRYDTAHGFAHCDVIHFNGKVEKTVIPTLNYRDALTYADEDLNENWQYYKELFLKEVKNDK
jgi:hypothetical protein